jgi:hydroxymethylbilane synthase
VSADAPVRIATRGSPLARWQAELVARRLSETCGLDSELVIVSTVGDRTTDVPISAMSGTGVFVKEVEEALLDGRADVAVHSAKDLPSQLAPGLVLAAIPEREDVRDALVGARLGDIPVGGSVATGSVRRRAQLAALRPDLVFHELRGNMATRLARVAEFDAIVVAAAAFIRLGWREHLTEVLEPSVMLPQVGQGAIAIECRGDDERVIAWCAAIDRPDARAAVVAERAFLAELGGGCDLPCGALAALDPTGSGRVLIEALLAAPDGSWVRRRRAAATVPSEAGRAVAALVLAEAGR